MQPTTFQIITDSGCDIAPELLAEWGVWCESLTFRFNDSEKEYLGSEMPNDEFYQKMRDGLVAKTAAVNTESFTAAFERALSEGRDVLYIGLSSGISNTYNAGRLAALAMNEKYPDRKVIAFDSLCASAGQGLLVYLAAKKAKEGATLEETAAYVEEMRPAIGHWFTVENLVYLKRGGRVSPTTALIGNALQIKPIMHVDDEGKLIKMGTAHGRRKSLATLAAKYKELAKTPGEGTIFISQADCKEEAELLADMICKQTGVTVELITNISPVIGAHAGPGTIALFFISNER